MLKEFLLRLQEKISFQNIRKTDFKKYIKFFSAFLILIIIGLLLPKGFTHAGFWDIIADGIYGLIYIIFWILFGVAWLIAKIGAEILNTTLNPSIMNQVFSSSAIKDGWTIIRDICNLLFLLIMLLVAFGTIIQSEKYNIKNSLLKLIRAIFLINFSWVIAGVVIDFGNILMYGILGWMCANEATCFLDMTKGLMGVVDAFWRTYAIGKVGLSAFSANQAIGMAMATIYTFMYGFILMALALFLVVRTAGLALLMILSPFSYFGEVMPGMQNLTNKWWDNLWNYALFGPIFALMLYVSGRLAEITITVEPLSDPDLAVYGTLIVTVIQNVIPLVFLLAIIPITKALSLAGTETIMKNTVGAGTGLAKFVGGVADRYMARGAQPGHGRIRRALSNISPGAWKRAIKAHTADNEHDYSQAAGKVRRRYVHRASDWVIHKSPVDYQQDAYEHDVARQNKDILSENSNELGQELKKALDRGMISRAEAIARKLAVKGDINNAMTGIKGKDGKAYENTQAGFVKFMDEQFKSLKPEGVARLKSDLAQAEKSAGNHSFKGTSEYTNINKTGDPKKDKWEWVNYGTEDKNNNEEHIIARKAAAEFGKVEPQAKWRGLDKRTLLDQCYDADGKPLKDENGADQWKLAERGEYILDGLTQADIANVRKAKPEQLKVILETLSDDVLNNMDGDRKTNALALKKAIKETLNINTNQGNPGNDNIYNRSDRGDYD